LGPGEVPLPRGALALTGTVEQMGLPRPGSKGVPVLEVEPQLGVYFEDMEGMMIAPAPEEARDSVGETEESFTAPFLRDRSVMLALLMRMAVSGMLRSVAAVYYAFGVFAVIKRYVDGVPVLRPVWDGRGPNRGWRRPPWVALSSPCSFADVDASRVGGGMIYSAVADLPDFFYTLLLPPQAWGYFGVPLGIGTQELLAFARKRGVDLPDLDPKLPMLAVAVCVMGWS